MADEEIIQYSVRDGIAHIVLNRPEKLNALSDDSVRLLRDLLFRLDDDDEAQVGILSGNGRAFCAGGDVRQRHLKPIEERAKLGSGQARDAQIDSLFHGYTKWKPVLAAVHGYVLGAGLHLALMSDMIVAAEGTQFQIAEIPRGADGGRFWALLTQRSMGAFATEVAVTGRRWTAEEALPVRAVDRVVPLGQQVPAAIEIAQSMIMKNPPLSVRAVVEARRGVLSEIELRARLTRQPALHLSDDFQESARAFAEKREPVFHGR
jgi:enoyl-CoA hydratase/carnithine racemase